MSTWWRRRRHRRPMSTCTFPTLRPVSRATPGASASESPRHHCHHHHHYHCQQPVIGDILRNYHLLSYLLLGPGELASRLRDEVAEAEAEWEPIDKAGDSVLRRRLNITLGTNILRYIVQSLDSCLWRQCFLHYNLTWQSRYWKLCGEGSGRPPRSEDPLDPPLESGRCEGNHSEGDNTVGIESILLGG